MKQRIVNFLKYNKRVYSFYHTTFSWLVNLLSFFVKTDDRLILFNSFAGRRYDDSPKEIFLEMKGDARFAGYKFVWAFHEPGKYDVPGAELIKTDNLKYFITALKSRVWVTNSSVERGLSFKGKHTFYLNTWHGTLIKFMGTDISGSNESFQSANKVSPYDIFCSQGRYETDIFSRSFGIKREHILECGLPRNDILSNYSGEYRETVRKKLKITSDQKVILYCPTFREYEKDVNLGVVMAPPITLSKWKEILGDQYVLLIRAHYEVSRVMDIQEDEFVRNVSSHQSLNELMIAADIMVSDYSSIFFDYAITGKPMLHFCYDYDTYFSKRGMYFDIRDWIDGAEDEDSLIDIIQRTKGLESSKTAAFRKQFVNYYGNAASLCVDCIARNIINES